LNHDSLFLLAFFRYTPIGKGKNTYFEKYSQKCPNKKGMFFKNQGPLFKDKGGFKIWKY